ncbi:MAG: TlpA family protein disulfide reductase [Chloroflexi bacterium]|nr:TlpA family protein disulfide reductase [Chloroflexota bacterium]MBP8058293.1 TlpA family protein disulfide reductase [Chloroflexota bacterium]
MTATNNTLSTPSTDKPEKGKIGLLGLLAVVLVLALLALLGWGLVNTNRTRPIEGNVAPDFSVTYYKGYEWDAKATSALNDFKGKVVVLNFWASWCVECRYEADLLEQAWRAYRDSDVVFLGVAYVDVEPKSREYLTEFNVTYPNAPDLRSLVSGAYEITGVPETFIIDQQGEIAYVQIGPIDAPTLYNQLNQLVGE